MSDQAAAAPGKLKLGTLLAFSAAGLPVGALTTPLLVYLPNYYAGYIGVGLGAVGLIFMTVKLLDLVFDPLLGMVMDQTRTPIGRYRFWMIVGAPILMLGVYMLFMAEPGAGAGYLMGWLIVLYIGFSMLVLSQSAWAGTLARRYSDRSNIFAGLTVTGVIAAVTVLLWPSLAKVAPVAVVPTMGWLTILSIPLAVAIVGIFVREPIVARREGADRLSLSELPGLIGHKSMMKLLATDLLLTLGPGFTSPLYLFFFKGARGYTDKEAAALLVLYIVSGLVAAPLWALVANRLQKHRTLLLTALLYSAAQAMVVLIPHHNMPLMSLGMFLAGAIAAAFGFLIRAMVADVADEIRLETGKERAGLLYALISSTVKIGTASAVITLPLLGVFGFNPKPGAVNTPEAMHALVATYVVLPVVAVALGGLVMLTYRLDRARHAEIRAALDERDRKVSEASEDETAIEAVAAQPIVT
jgi:GPH family glycoside/pentoside/hexuronide:cation symporter